MWYIVAGYIMAVYLLTNTVTPRLFGGVIDAYVVRPILWTSVAILTLIIARSEGIEIWYFRRIRRWQFGRSPFEGALLIGAFQVSLLVIAGLFYGFGRSPNSFTPLSILTNAFLVFSFLFGMELGRAYLIKKASRRNLILSLTAVTVFLMIVRISFNRFMSLDPNNPLLMIRFFGEMVIPFLAMGFFASYLAYLGGALTSIGYMAVIVGFEWFCPILPDLEWIMSSLIKTIAPAIGFMIMQSSIEYSLPKRLRRSRDSTFGWIGAALVSLMIIFFSFGYFGVQPIIIVSGSMRPTLDVGDLVIIERVDPSKIRKGDIIEYRVGRMSIVHRVVEIKKEGFVTKGDANRYPDPDPVHPDQIRGKVIFTVPKIGWIPLILKELIHRMVKMR